MTVYDNRLGGGGEFKWAGTTLDYGGAVHSRGVVAFDGSEWQRLSTGAGGDVLEVCNGQLYAGGLGGARPPTLWCVGMAVSGSIPAHN